MDTSLITYYTGQNKKQRLSNLCIPIRKGIATNIIGFDRNLIDEKSIAEYLVSVKSKLLLNCNLIKLDQKKKYRALVEMFPSNANSIRSPRNRAAEIHGKLADFIQGND